MAHSEVEAPLVDIRTAVVETVAPTENHDSEGGDAEDHSHQSDLYFLKIPVKEIMLENR
jgi:hypothetical protein